MTPSGYFMNISMILFVQKYININVFLFLIDYTVYKKKEKEQWNVLYFRKKKKIQMLLVRMWNSKIWTITLKGVYLYPCCPKF